MYNMLSIVNSHPVSHENTAISASNSDVVLAERIVVIDNRQSSRKAVAIVCGVFDLCSACGRVLKVVVYAIVNSRAREVA